VIKIHSPVGNIFLDDGVNDLKSESLELLQLSRLELEKRILRRKTNRGTDVCLNLDLGVKLCHGDVIINDGVKIIVEQLPEKVMCVRLKTKNMVDVTILLGHIIGNRHRPISIQDDEILFPIQSDSEKEVFTKLFQSMINQVEITIQEKIFFPHSGANVYEH
jgi:urease accessory protein